MQIERLFKFFELINNFQSVERSLWLKGREHRENDVEHSYQLAMAAWYLISTEKLDLDADKAVRYAMLHDLVEVYAGDVNAFDKDPEVHANKAAREHEALLKLKEEFSEFPDMTETIERYETRSDEEAKFVYALDKIIAPINVYMDGGRTWKKKEITFDALIENKISKVSAHPETKKYFDELVKILEKEKHLFHQDEKV